MKARRSPVPLLPSTSRRADLTFAPPSMPGARSSPAPGSSSGESDSARSRALLTPPGLRVIGARFSVPVRELRRAVRENGAMRRRARLSAVGRAARPGNPRTIGSEVRQREVHLRVARAIVRRLRACATLQRRDAAGDAPLPGRRTSCSAGEKARARIFASDEPPPELLDLAAEAARHAEAGHHHTLRSQGRRPRDPPCVTSPSGTLSLTMS